MDTDKETHASSIYEKRIEKIENSLKRITEEFNKLKNEEVSLIQFNTRITPFVNGLSEKGRNVWKLYAIFVIIISLLGGSIAFLIHYLFTGIVDVPAVQVQIVSSSRNAVIQVANEGKIPITNLNLTIKLPEGFEAKALTNLTSVDTKWNLISPSILKAHVNKLIHGTGSIMYISIPIAENETSNCNDYAVYAVYDEGSTKGYCSVFFDIIYQFNIQHSSVKIGILVTLTIILTSILLIFIPRYLNTIIIRKRRR